MRQVLNQRRSCASATVAHRTYRTAVPASSLRVAPRRHRMPRYAITRVLAACLLTAPIAAQTAHCTGSYDISV